MSKTAREVIAKDIRMSGMAEELGYGDEANFEMADTIIMRLAEAGFVIVPKNPTVRMLAAANEAALETSVLMDDSRFACERAYWSAMIAAASTPTEEKG